MTADPPPPPNRSGIQVIPVGLFHQLRLDHEARTVELQRIPADAAEDPLSRNECLREAADAILQRSRWVKLGYAVVR